MMPETFIFNPSQQGIWENELAFPKTAVNTISVRLTVNIKDPVRVKEAVDTVIKNSDVFYAKLSSKEAEPAFLLQDNPISLSEITGVMEADDAIEYVSERDSSPLPKDTLYEAKIVPLAGDHSMVYARFHHVIIDGFGMSLFVQKVLDSIEGREVKRSSFFSKAPSYENDDKADEKFWLDYFKDVDFSPSVYSEEPTSIEKELYSRPLPRYFQESLFDFAARNDTTVPYVMLSAFAIYLSGATVKDDAVILMPRLNRRPEEMETLGCYTLLVPVRIHIDEKDSFLDVVRKAAKAGREASKHKGYGMSKLMKLLRSDSIVDESVSEYVFNYYSKKPYSENTGFDLFISVAGAMHNHITMTVGDSGESLVMALDGRCGVTGNERLSFFADSIETILKQGIKRPNDPVSNFSIIGDVETIRVLSARGTDSPYDREATIISEFDRAVRRFGKRPAIYAGDKSLSYKQLDALTDNIACGLKKRGVRTGDAVLILLKRDINLIPAEIGVMKAGAAFVPVDTEYPDDRIRLILEDSGAVLTISSDEAKRDWLEFVDIKELVSESGAYERPRIDGESLAYMIYTSGTTGVPKGVMLLHKGIVNITRADNNPFNRKLVKDCYGLTAVGSVGFDISLFEFFVPLMNGIFVELAPEEALRDARALSKVITAHSSDALHLTPSRLESYLKVKDFAKAFKSIKAVLSAGEALGTSFAQRIAKDYEAELFNGYGPTETTIGITITEAGDTETIGRPIGNMGVLILGKGSLVLPYGATGEIVAFGRGLGIGYKNLPEKTAEKYTMVGNIPAYRTGDLGYFLPNGAISFRGRNDRLIKLRGLRIELPEIENAIAEVKGVGSCACIVKKSGRSEHLVAFYTKNKGIDVTEKEILSSVSKKLPSYMVPDAVVCLPEMPQTMSGKTDLKALSLLEVKLEKNYVKPRDEDEKYIALCMGDVLSLEKVGADDNFFDIGGNSLDISALIIKLEERFGEGKIDTAMIYQYPTPALLKGKLEGSIKETKGNPLSVMNYRGFSELLSKDGIKRKKKDPGNILITGVTGYLGIHILFDILNRPDDFKGHIYCLARSKDGNSAEKRVRTSLFYYRDSDFGESYKSKWEVIDGDISEDDIDNFEFEHPVNTVINCAAKVSHFAADDSLSLINTKGVDKLIDFCLRNNATLCQLSTISVCGAFKDSSVQRTFSETDFFNGQEISNKYILSKYNAEYNIFRAAIDKGLDFKIIRIGNLQGRISDGEFQMNLNTNAFTRQLSSYVKIGAVPDKVYSSKVNFSPVDDTAHMTASLVASEGELRIFHVYPPDEAPYSTLFDVLEKIGYPIEILNEKKFENRVSDLKHQKGGDKILSGILTERPDLSYTAPLVVNSLTLDALKDLSERWHVMTEDYFTKYLTLLDDMGMFLDLS